MAQSRDKVAAVGLILVAGLLLWPFWALTVKQIVIIVAASYFAVLLLSDALFVKNGLLAALGIAVAQALDILTGHSWLDTRSLVVFLLCLASLSAIPIDLQFAIRPATAVVCGVGSWYFLPVTDTLQLSLEPPLFLQLLLFCASPLSILLPLRFARMKWLYCVIEPYLLTLVVWVVALPFVEFKGFASFWLLFHFWLVLGTPSSIAWFVAVVPRLVSPRRALGP
jgi:hypothetical protein